MLYPALDVSGANGDLLLALLDDFSPSAVDDRDDRLTIFFPSPSARDAAHGAIVREFPLAIVTPREVDDENWARRSQENLRPVTIGRITVSPPWAAAAPGSRTPASSLEVVILPSMGFGTGHHATTRLCLAALQTLDLTGKAVVDVGTGSGVLAIAASVLGARQAVGIDFDADAIGSAEENLTLNPDVTGVRFVTVDLREEEPSEPADVVTANLTGALLTQNAPRLVGRLAPGGTLIVSGLQAHERDGVVAAIAADLAWEQAEEDWVGLVFNARGPRPV